MTGVARGHLRICVRHVALAAAAAQLPGGVRRHVVHLHEEQRRPDVPASAALVGRTQAGPRWPSPQGNVPDPWQRSFDAAGTASLDHTMTYAPTPAWSGA